MGVDASSASNVIWKGLVQIDTAHAAGWPVALKLLMAGGVESTTKRSLTFSPVVALPAVWEGASEATTLTW